jgi:DNA-binding NtrC family response regulator
MTSTGSEHQVANATGPDRILILEDEAWDAELAQRLLTEAGLDYTAVIVDTKSAFTEQLAEFRPDLILSDYSLPGFSGADALQIAQQQCPQVPFIIWSGVLGDEAAVDLIKQGATDYILKDRPARLPSAIERALREARRRARLAQIEVQLGQAQRLASLGRLTAAEEAVHQTRELLAGVRSEVTAPDGDGQVAAGSDGPKVPPVS